jgi:hypothetical protein
MSPAHLHDGVPFHGLLVQIIPPAVEVFGHKLNMNLFPPLNCLINPATAMDYNHLVGHVENVDRMVNRYKASRRTFKRTKRSFSTY